MKSKRQQTIVSWITAVLLVITIAIPLVVLGGLRIEPPPSGRPIAAVMTPSRTATLSTLHIVGSRYPLSTRYDRTARTVSQTTRMKRVANRRNSKHPAGADGIA